MQTQTHLYKWMENNFLIGHPYNDTDNEKLLFSLKWIYRLDHNNEKCCLDIFSLECKSFHRTHVETQIGREERPFHVLLHNSQGSDVVIKIHARSQTLSVRIIINTIIIQKILTRVGVDVESYCNGKQHEVELVSSNSILNSLQWIVNIHFIISIPISNNYVDSKTFFGNANNKNRLVTVSIGLYHLTAYLCELINEKVFLDGNAKGCG